MISGPSERREPSESAGEHPPEYPEEHLPESRKETAPRLLVGLGNPGPQYAGTRHNVGFAVLDLLATRLGVEPTGFRVGGRRIADLYHDPEHGFALLWPLSYMNLSGGPVVAALRAVEAVPRTVFVITDDFHLPLGAIRTRASGSAGGHNGLTSVEESLGTQEYPRMRIGVGDPSGEAADYVLSRFRRSEEKVVEEMLETASWAAEDWVKGASVEDIQARYNRRMP